MPRSTQIQRYPGMLLAPFRRAYDSIPQNSREMREKDGLWSICSRLESIKLTKPQVLEVVNSVQAYAGCSLHAKITKAV